MLASVASDPTAALALPSATTPQNSQNLAGEFAALVSKLCGDVHTAQSGTSGSLPAEGNSAAAPAHQNWLTLFRQSLPKPTLPPSSVVAGQNTPVQSLLSIEPAPGKEETPVDDAGVGEVETSPTTTDKPNLKKGDSSGPQDGDPSPAEPSEPTEALPPPANAALPLVVLMVAPPVQPEKTSPEKSDQAAETKKRPPETPGAIQQTTMSEPSANPQEMLEGPVQTDTVPEPAAPDSPSPELSAPAKPAASVDASRTVAPGKDPARSAASEQLPTSNSEAGNVKDYPAPKVTATAATTPIGSDSTNESSAVPFDAFVLQLHAVQGLERQDGHGGEKGAATASTGVKNLQMQGDGGFQPEGRGQQPGQQHPGEAERQPANTPGGAGRKEQQREAEGGASTAIAPPRSAKANIPGEAIFSSAPAPHRAEQGTASVQAAGESSTPAGSNAGDVVRQIEALRLSGVNLPRQQPVHDVEIRVQAAGNPVDVKLTDRGGGIEISVHSADAQLAQDLRAQLPELIESLHSRGYEATNVERERPQQELAGTQASRWSAPDDGAGEEAARRRDAQQQGAKRGRSSRDRAKPEFSIEPEPVPAGVL